MIIAASRLAAGVTGQISQYSHYSKSNHDLVSLYEVRPALTSPVIRQIIVAIHLLPTDPILFHPHRYSPHRSLDTQLIRQQVTSHKRAPRNPALYLLARDGASPDTDAATVISSRLKRLLPWILELLWALSLGNYLVDNLLQKTAAYSIAPANGTMTTIVFENLTEGFHKPFILDVK